MNKKDNKRAQDSKQRLKRAVCNLLKEVGHEKITIKSLCKEAGVNRTTFYAHFDDIEDLLYEICEEYIVGCFKIFMNTEVSYRIRIKNAVELIRDDMEFFAYVFRNVHNLELKVLNMVEILYTDNDYLAGAEKAKLSLAFIISGFVGVGKIYFSSDKCKMNPDEFADILYNAINMSNSYFIIK